MKSAFLNDDLLALQHQTREFVSKEVVPAGDAWEPFQTLNQDP